jgi:2-amino-4-hydroxy-6-hydroxymethyldihydropteridine diphosphokinase
MRVFIGLGSNIGDREANLRLALRWLAPECRVDAVSSLYGSAAVVLDGQPPGPDFLNAVCEVETELAPATLLSHLKRIEHDIGRRPAARWTPRPIDLDILLYGDHVVDEATPHGQLVVPHRLLTERNFVLVPLAEIAPGALHAPLGRTIGIIAEDADFDGLTWVASPAWVSGFAQDTDVDVDMEDDP